MKTSQILVLPSGLRSAGLIQRVLLLTFLFSLELVTLCAWLDTSLRGAATLRFVVVFFAILVTVGYEKAKSSVQQISSRFLRTPIALRLLVAHFGAMAGLAWLSARWMHSASPRALINPLLAGGWVLLGMVAVGLAVFAFAPPKLWWAAFRATGNAWGYALAVGFLSCLAVNASQLLWAPVTHVTFLLVGTLLRPFVAGLTSDVSTYTIGTPAFSVIIAPSCSGIEGAGLMLVMGGVWLWIFRREFRFPRAFLLIPTGVAALYLLNAVRIALLILIGHGGASGIATSGFHSQAGWIAFIAVAVGISRAARRIPWLSAASGPGVMPETAAADPNTAYLMPFLLVLGATMISRAASAQFEWLYPLRFLAAAAALWHYRSEYRHLNRSLSWVAVLAGTGALLVWLVLEVLLIKPGNDAGFSLALASVSPTVRISWMALRILAAVVTVPIAEELAFRGFLMRRIVSPAFTSVNCQSVRLLPILISSLAFGALHGDRWLAGTIAGVLYAYVYLRRGRIVDAVVAHATTNALLAGYVVLWGKWSLW